MSLKVVHLPIACQVSESLLFTSRIRDSYRSNSHREKIPGGLVVTKQLLWDKLKMKLRPIKMAEASLLPKEKELAIVGCGLVSGSRYIAKPK